MKQFEALAPFPATNQVLPPQPQATGVPYLKDLIFSGEYKHPDKGFTLKMDRERMDKLAATFGEMKTAGVKTPIYSTHKGGSLATLGYVDAVARGGTPAAQQLEARRGDKSATDPDTLYALCSFSDADSEALAKRVKQVSIQINPKFRDGMGRNYGEAIEHVAVTPEPVVPGQKDFEQLAFSLSCEESDGSQRVLFLHRDDAHSEGALSMAKDTEKKEEKADEGMCVGSKAFDMCSKHLSKCLGAEHEDVKGLKPENAVPTLIKHHAALVEQHGNLKDAHDKLNEAHAAQAKLAASREVPAPVLNMVAKAGETQLDAVCAKGCITPKVRDGLKALLVGAPGKRNALALSLEGETEENQVSRIAKVLEDNTPVALGEATKSQAVALAREVPGDTAAKHDPKVTETMVEMANRGR